jgi:hypothetical protein
MNSALLSEFLAEEGSLEIREKLLVSIREPDSRAALKFTFNRFNIILDYEKKEVTVEDDLTVGPEGEFNLGFEEFVRALQENN